jgi:ubiquitin C-terminal hydrolase
MGVDRCAPTLVVHFKRFSTDRFSKIDTAVEYPDVLDTADFAATPTGTYRLIGAVFHSGGLGGGHYTAAALDQPSGQWYYFNDSSASRVDKSGAHRTSAYIIVYEKL